MPKPVTDNVVFAFNERNFQAGESGSQQGAIVDGATGIVALITQGNNWPLTGGDALTLTIEVSLDAGSNWQPPCVTATFPDSAYVNGENWLMGSINPGTNRRGRLSWSFLKSVRMAGSLATR
jgi:hypothetical protein